MTLVGIVHMKNLPDKLGMSAFGLTSPELFWSECRYSILIFLDSRSPGNQYHAPQQLYYQLQSLEFLNLVITWQLQFSSYCQSSRNEHTNLDIIMHSKLPNSQKKMTKNQLLANHLANLLPMIYSPHSEIH